MIYTISNGSLSVSADTMGAQLMSIKSAEGVEYLWQGDARYWSDRSLTLFPYVARLTEGKYSLDDQIYEMDIHGLAPYTDFVITDISAESMTMAMTDTPDTYKHFPRRFRFLITYSLDGCALNITYRVENADDRTMYFGIGGHPGFNVPLEDGKSFEDYRLRFSNGCSPYRVGFTPTYFLNGQDVPYPLNGDSIPLTHSMFDDDAIVLGGVANEVTLEAADGKRSVTVTYPDMPYLGIWHMPHTDAPYVCIEPWRSLPSTQDVIAVLEEQRDLVSLEAGGVYENKWSILIR